MNNTEYKVGSDAMEALLTHEAICRSCDAGVECRTGATLLADLRAEECPEGIHGGES